MVAVSKSFVHISIWCTTFEILIILICHAAILSLYTMITTKVGTTHCWIEQWRWWLWGCWCSNKVCFLLLERTSWVSVAHHTSFCYLACQIITPLKGGQITIFWDHSVRQLTTSSSMLFLSCLVVSHSLWHFALCNFDWQSTSTKFSIREHENNYLHLGPGCIGLWAMRGPKWEYSLSSRYPDP